MKERNKSKLTVIVLLIVMVVISALVILFFIIATNNLEANEKKTTVSQPLTEEKVILGDISAPVKIAESNDFIYLSRENERENNLQKLLSHSTYTGTTKKKSFVLI